MATVKDMIRRASSKMDDSLDNTDFIDWFNDCQNEQMDILFLPSDKTITKLPTATGFVIPNDVVSLLDVYVGGNILDPRRGEYTRMNNLLVLADKSVNTIHIVYNKKPAEIKNNPDQVPEIPSQFHRIFEFYACMMAMLADEEHERYQGFYSQYITTRIQLEKYMARQRSIYRPLNAWGVER